MRYLIHTVSGDVTTVPETDDKKFHQLIAERRDDGYPLYEQTGAHDPRVTAVEVSGQDPANGEPRRGLIATEIGEDAVVGYVPANKKEASGRKA